uniref:Histone deacetylase n=1 Tax=Glossina morsitans morsitans TaxID=37546 RepID=A0A1B0GEF2_GLOMM
MVCPKPFSVAYIPRAIRASLTHNLIHSYGLLEHMELVRPRVCNTADLRAFHTVDYIAKLDNYENCTPKEKINDSDSEEEEDLNCSLFSETHGLSYDCPPWRGIKSYVCCIAGSTMTASDILVRYHKDNEIVINWCGGWHHARRDKATGFCYVNDIVLGLLVLAKKFTKILYIDLDNHHGDAVEWTFAASRRVFTLSFHQLECGYYPGTGSALRRGRDKGMGFSVNFPYKSGITGTQYIKYFKKISSKVFNYYRPEICVIQCGGDVIVGDPLGGSNLIPDDLINCVKHILDFQKPTLLLGGGGYNLQNSSRYWCLLTAAVCGITINDDIPAHNADFLTYGPDYCLTIESKLFLKNNNVDEDLDKQLQLIEDGLEKYLNCKEN